MNTLSAEFSNKFDILYNNIDSNQAPGLDIYEKSVFLTKAQEEILKNYFNPLHDTHQEGFDSTAKRQIDFSRLIKNKDLQPGGSPPYDRRSSCYELPEDLFFILNESVKLFREDPDSVVEGKKIETEIILPVVPISYVEYDRLMSKPYQYPPKNKVWRYISEQANGKQSCELILGPNDGGESYRIRYVRRPKPIILDDISGYGVTIEGINTESECELDSILYEQIINRAVELAKAAWAGDLSSVTQINNRDD